MLYHILGALIRFATLQFFRTINVRGESEVLDGPVIFAPNHPNEAVDPFMMGTVSSRPLFFLAKSTLFTNPFLRFFFESLHMIPVYRKRDNSDTSKNDATFRAVAEALKHGEALVIFPEGTSQETRQVLPLKTGAARMAFLAESQNNFSLGVKIQPVSITYSDPYTFQSSVTVTYGEPIPVANYQEMYNKDPQVAAKQLTHDLEVRLRSLAVDLKDLSNQPLVEKIVRLFSTEGADDRARFQEITGYVEALAPKLPEKKKEMELRIDQYLEMASVFHLEYFHPYFNRSQSLTHKIISLMLSPIVFFGVIANAVPYFSVRALITLFKVESYNFASAKIGLSIVLFPLWYLSIFCLLDFYLWGQIISLEVTILVMFSGYLTNRFFDRVWLTTIQLCWPFEPNPVKTLTIIRDDLRSDLLKLAELLTQEAEKS